VNKDIHIVVVVVVLGMWAEENDGKMENKKFVPFSQLCSSTPVGFIQGFLT
jgi:hypothetical protein